MNILYICDEYPPGQHGGIGTSVQILAREMVCKGHNVVVAGFYEWGYMGEDEFEDQGVQVYRFRRKLASPLFHNKQSLYIRALYKLLTLMGIMEWDVTTSMKKYDVFLHKLIKQHNIDIVEIPDWVDYMRFCKTPVYFPKLPVPTLIKLNGSYTYFIKEEGSVVPQQIWKVDHALLINADAVAGVSKYTATKTAEYLEDSRPMAVLHNGIAVPRYIGVTQKKKNKVIFTGTLVKKKGIFQLAKAWNIVNRDLPDAELWIFGKGSQEKLKAELSSSAKEKVFINSHISREELFIHLTESQVGVFPSYAECFALAPMEALACGTAVINTNRTSGPELIQDGINGLLIDPDNVEQIAEKIIYLLKHPDETDRLAFEGKKHVLQKFGIDVIAEANLEFYKAILNKHDSRT